MNVYVDSSVLLRVVLGEPGRLKAWSKIDNAVSSELVRVESLRTIDRARIRLGLSDDVAAGRRAAVIEMLDSFHMVAVDQTVLDRATEPFPTLLGTLDAIHLATALLVRDAFDDLTLATHDGELALAARAVGFPVLGASSG